MDELKSKKKVLELWRVAWAYAGLGFEYLALMVSDFLENGSSSGPNSWCSGDSESGLSDLHHLGDKILVI